MINAMDSHLHHTSHLTESMKTRMRAERIYMTVQTRGVRQVRLYRDWLLTYPWPAKRGYGVRGVLVGIYTLTTRLEWIEEDLLQFLSERES